MNIRHRKTVCSDASRPERSPEAVRRIAVAVLAFGLLSLACDHVGVRQERGHTTNGQPEESAQRAPGEVPNQSTSPRLAALLNPFATDDRQQAVHNGFQIEVSRVENDEQVTIRRGTHVFVKWPMPDTSIGTKWAGFASLPLLARADSQLVLFHGPGGAHSAPSLRIYDLQSTPRLLFDSDAYSYLDGHGDRGWSDLDADGIAEIIVHTAAFAYFDGLPYSISPFPPLIFRYNADSGRYRLANRSFGPLLLGDVKALGPSSKDDVSSILNAMLPYLYTGHAEEGWNVFDRFYTKDNKAAVAGEIRKELARDPAYRELGGLR